MAVDEIVHDDFDDGSMQCTNHPYKNNINQGGICAFCLQEKLGKLVSSSFPIAVFPSSSTSSSPSFRSDASASASASASIRLQSTRNDFNEKTTTNNDSHFHYSSSSSSTRRARIPSFLLTQRKKNKNLNTSLPGASHSSAVVYNRSMSTTTPGRGINPNDSDTPSRRGFWSFLYYSRQTNKNTDKPCNEICPAPISTAAKATATVAVSNQSLTQGRDSFIVVEENESPDATPFDRKVSRSRSVGCGSRSFSGDFFERLSTGFGDCTLRRVESQREGKVKSRSRQDSIKERVKCGGIFSGFMLAGSSSSSSNSYFVSSSSSSTEGGGGGNLKGKVTTGGMGHHLSQSHGRSRSWGWAFASPMRALGKPASSSSSLSSSSALYPSIKRSEARSVPNKNNAIPSLLVVRG